MSIKQRLYALEKLHAPAQKLLAYFENQETLEQAKAKRGWQDIPDNELKIIRIINAPKIRNP
jgi:hypothetical protein